MTQKRTTNRITALLLALLTMLSLCTFVTAGQAFAASDGEWYYNVVDGKAEITSYIGTSTTVTVPSLVNGYAVKKVSGLAKTNQKTKITSITFSQGITEIANGVCDGYTALEKVSLPTGMLTIGSSAFARCTALKGIIIPNSVTTIGASAFEGCTALISANIQCSISEIPSKLFYGCTSLGNVTMPVYITAIGDYAFYNCSTLTTLTVTDTVKTIGNNAFQGCSKLANLRLPASLNKIGNNAFDGCTSFTKMYIPVKAKTLGEECFKNCTGMTEIYLSPSVNKIGTNCFTGCKNLSKVVFGGGYVNLTNVFDLSNVPTVFYPSSKASDWSQSTALKQNTYAASTKITVAKVAATTVGETVTLKVTNYPSNAVFNDKYFFTSDNKVVATVDDNGVVTAMKAGTANITVTTINGISTTVAISVKPRTVTDVKAVPTTINSVTVSWKDTGVAGYYVYRSTSENGTYSKIATVTAASSYTDKGLTKGKTYYYKVEAYQSSSLVSAKSEAAKVTVTSPTPTGVKATKANNTSATIKWNKAGGANGYVITMATSKNGKYTTIKTITNGSTLSFTKTGLTLGKTYYFKVWSYTTVSGSKVYSPASEAVTLKMSIPTPTGVNAKKVKSGCAQITWNSVSSADGYIVTMATSKDGSYSTVKTTTSNATTIFNKTGLTAGSTYYFKVWSYVTVNGKKVYSSASLPVSVKV